MGIFDSLLGTSSLLFRLGLGSNSVQWKNDGASRILARNSSDSAYVRVQGLDPTAAQDFVTLGYLGGQVGYKGAVRAASTGNLSLSGLAAVDGVAIIAGDRVLAKDQTTASQNGIYVAAAGAWTRATDFDSTANVTPMCTVPISEGTVWGNSSVVLTTDDPITVGVTALTFGLGTGVGRVGNAQPLGIRALRQAVTAPTDATKLGFVSLGSQSVAGSTGVLSNYGTCGGGDRNTISSAADYGTCGGGLTNSILATHGTIGGGQSNTISTTATHGAICGGQGNSISSGTTHGTIGGGNTNTIGSACIASTIGGGLGNSINGSQPYCTIAGGRLNTCNGLDYNTVGGGHSNSAGAGAASFSSYATVCGGFGNNAYGSYDSILGGSTNNTGQVAVNAGGTSYCAIAGGDSNLITRSSAGTVYPTYGFVGGGRLNRVRRAYAAAFGRECESGDDAAPTTFGVNAFVHGYRAFAWMDGQYSHGGGIPFAGDLGGAQYGRLIMSAQATNVASAVKLRPQGNGSAIFFARANRLYVVTVKAVAMQSVALALGNASFFFTFTALVNNAGLVTLIGATTSVSNQSSGGGSAGWTLVPSSSGLNDNEIILTFTAVVAAGQPARCVATVEWTEVQFT